MIYNFNNFILEHSKNDPMPELTWDKKGKTIIFLFGVPGAGKSTFTKNFLTPKLDSYKIFDPDELMKILIKIGKEKYKATEGEKLEKLENIRRAFGRLNMQYGIPINLTDEEIMNIIEKNVYVPGSYNIFDSKFVKFLESGNNSDVIYDTTGNDFNRIEKYTTIAKENGYNVLFVKVDVSVESAIRGNLERVRRVQPDYQLASIEKSKELELKYLDLEPEAYYIYDRDEDILFKFEDGKAKFVKQNLLNKDGK